MQKIVVANWKMNSDINLVKQYENNFNGYSNLIVAPPHVYLNQFKLLSTAAQNIHAIESGAFTGEISIHHIKDAGAQFCILGHSERRTYNNETNALVKEKANLCLKHQITPIICIGETLNEYKSQQTLDVLKTQITECLPEQGKFYVAYEPIWAIGTNLTPTLEEIQAFHAFIKTHTSATTPILYGGSVNAENAQNILSINNVDGVLVGGASLKIDAMQSILESIAIKHFTIAPPLLK